MTKFWDCLDSTTFSSTGPGLLWGDKGCSKGRLLLRSSKWSWYLQAGSIFYFIFADGPKIAAVPALQLDAADINRLHRYTACIALRHKGCAELLKESQVKNLSSSGSTKSSTHPLGHRSIGASALVKRWHPLLGVEVPEITDPSAKDPSSQGCKQGDKKPKAALAQNFAKGMTATW